MDNPTVSVIVPVFRSERYIDECIKSLRNQELSDIEMIFVDDKGGDGSMDVVRLHQAEDERIKIVENEENSGAGFSRNQGIEAATGEYLSFIDPDDTVALDFLKLLYEKAQRTGADIVKGSRDLVYIEDGEEVATLQEINKGIRAGLAKGNPIFNVFTFQHTTAIYRRSLVMDSGARYGDSRNGQDTTFLLRLGFYAKSLEFEDRALYHYQQREGSAVHVFTERRLQNELHALREKFDFIIDVLPRDEFTYNHVERKLKGILRVHAAALVEPSLTEQVTSEFFEGLFAEATRVSEAQLVVSDSPVIEALFDYKVNLVTPSAVNGVDYDEAVSFAGFIDRWEGFLMAHPECGEKYWTQMKRIIKRGMKQDLIDSEGQGSPDFSERLKELGNNLSGPLESIEATWNDTVIEASLEYGTNLFPFPKSEDMCSDAWGHLKVAQRWLEVLQGSSIKRQYSNETKRAIRRVLRTKALMDLNPSMAKDATDIASELRASMGQSPNIERLLRSDRLLRLFFEEDINLVGFAKGEDAYENVVQGVNHVSRWLDFMRSAPDSKIPADASNIRRSTAAMLDSFDEYLASRNDGKTF